MSCRYAFSSRQSDITIADYWGVEEHSSEHFKGVSLVITHSSAGEDYLNKADITLKPTFWNKFINRNPRMILGNSKFYNLHPGRVFAPWLFSHLSYSNLCKIYGVSEKRGMLGFPFMVSSFVIRKISNIFFKRTLKSKIKQLNLNGFK